MSRLAYADDDDRRPSGEEIYAPAAGADVIRAAPPTWCGSTNKADMPRDAPESFYEPVSIVGQVRDSLGHQGFVTLDVERRIAWSACLAPNSKVRQQWVASWRQAMVNTSGMTAQDNADWLALLMMSPGKLDAHEQGLCTKLADSDRSPLEAQVISAARRALLGCKDPSPGDEAAWSVARRKAAFPNQVVGLAFVINCLEVRAEDLGLDEPHLLNSNRLARFATCGHDARALDKAAFAADLKALRVDAVERIEAIQQFDLAKLFIAQLTAGYAKAIKRLPALDDVLYKAPEAGFAAWVKQATQWSAALALAEDAEAKYLGARGSKSALVKAFAGCGAPLRKGFTDYLRAAKPATAAQARAAAQAPIGVALLSALAACDAVEGRALVARAELQLMIDDSYRNAGPRAAAYAAALRALGDIEADQSKFPVHGNEFLLTAAVSSDTNWAKDAFDQVHADADQAVAGEWTDVEQVSKGDRPAPSDGQIDQITPSGNDVKITFKSVTWREAMLSCVTTNHIDRVEWNGNQAEVIYGRSCKPAGTEPRTSKLSAISVPAALATGLRPGMFARVFAITDGGWRGKGARPGFVIEAYPDKTRKRLVYAAGAAL
ncbi:MAG TPA: hypothetical protein VFP84_30780 [Kofleriaceae bacterium]|nr:hypothetical protein [Kofleriaceae bacterium]